MILRHTNHNLGGQFVLTIHEPVFRWDEADEGKMIHILWNHSAEEVELEVDGNPIVLPPQSVLTTTFHYKVTILSNHESLIIFSFNKPYYCIYDHDSEVSCNGIIFFGAQEQTVISLDDVFRRKMKLLLEVFVDEFSQQDNIQGEMLMVLLKRLIIICTRLAKKQSGIGKAVHEEVETVRKFHYLVDVNFREIKSVKEYADLMFKSPKTLSNIFSKIGEKTPLRIIHERIALEARRQLAYTDKNINEIAFELGFEEPATFFKLFKRITKETPQTFRKNRKKPIKGKIDI